MHTCVRIKNRILYVPTYINIRVYKLHYHRTVFFGEDYGEFIYVQDETKLLWDSKVCMHAILFFFNHWKILKNNFFDTGLFLILRKN